MTCLLDSDSVQLTIWSSSAVLLVTALIMAQSGSGIPSSQLGKYPMGRGLWTYLFNYWTTGTGVWGYDSSLGALAPPIRVQLHASFLVALVAILWSALCVEQSGDIELCGWTADDTWTSSLLVQISCVALVVYIAFFVLLCKFSRGVSDPGGPRAHKIQRVPKWDDKTTQYTDSISDSKSVTWRCTVAQESHSITEAYFAENLEHKKANGHASTATKTLHTGLTGEPAGRQMWSMLRNAKSVKVDAHLVEEMACSGRKKGFNPSINPNSCDQPFRAQQIREYLASGKKAPALKAVPKNPKEAAKKAIHFYSMLQTQDGHWAGDYGGPHFLMPGMVIAWYVMGKPDLIFDAEKRALMMHYLKVHQQSDGGWGTHIESPSTMFGSCLCYVALRLLGADSNSEACQKGRSFIQSNGGATMTSSWAKFWLCVLGCYEWDGHNSVPPEMWCLPNWFPFHPGRMWCHCRMVYLPMGYLYGSRFVYSEAETDPTIQSLRKELYYGPYDSIPWGKTRHLVAPMDNYSPLPFVMKILQDILAFYESWSIFQPLKNFVRSFGLKFCVEYMAAEDLQTNYVDIGPVNKALNMISAFYANGSDLNHPTVINHMMRVADFFWIAEDGMKMQGYNGSQCWDTSFALQAIYECDLLDEFPDVARKGWEYMERTQILSTDVSQLTAAYEYEKPQKRDKFYRHVSKGGWPFSTSAHGWPIADCTGEGLKASLCLLKCKAVADGIMDGTLKTISEERFQDAVNVLLTLQNEDGGWATYENNRGFGWYEQLNPSEVFGDIMIDYSYVELSMATITALVDFRELYPNHRKTEILHAIAKGREFLKSIQREDGSWYGSWACCFCYGCWFGIEGLIKAGEPVSSPAIQKCCQFLLSHQRENGGWGEDFTSCYDKAYAENGMDAYGDNGSGVVNTGWALLALSAAKCDDVVAVKKGVKYLMKRQLPSGDWPQEGISGVFNRACGITYTSYRNVFPIWALGRCCETYDLEEL